jgi:hypothetical protein
MCRLIRFALILAAVLAMPLRGYATDLSYDNGAGASVLFTSSGGNMTVTLSNNWTGDPARAREILTGVLFNVDPAIGDLITTGTAVICKTCSVTNGGKTDPGGSVGGEWAFRGGLWFDEAYGISSVSLGAFNKVDLFGGTNLAGTAAGPGGLDYGITTKSDTPGNDQKDLAGIPLILNQVIFTFSGLPKDFDPSTAIKDVNFQFGTTVSNTPEPTSLALLGLGGATAWIVRRRRKATA